MSLDDLRRDVDRVDAELVKLLAERLRLSARIGETKKAEGRPVLDAGREAVVFERIAELAQGEGIPPAAAEQIYRQIIAQSRRVQGLPVAFQGEAGAYSEAAALAFFGAGTATLPCEGLPGVFQAVAQGRASYGVVPVENSLEGSIAQTYDLLLESPLMVAGELNLRVSHCLIANPGATLASVKRVYSHPQALGQCQAFLRKLPVEIVPSYDTAGAVKMIKEQHLLDGAAVASARAAALYGMATLASAIEDYPHNYTRFFVLGEQDASPTGDDKTSLVFSVKHRPGSLYSFLGVLKENGLNLTKIESRPTRHKPWEYNFYLDFEGHRREEPARGALARLMEEATFLKVLGSYPRASTGEGA